VEEDMTIKELNQLHHLTKLIERDEMEIRRIEERLDVKSPSLTGMPHAPGAHDKLGEGVPELVDRKSELEERRKQYTEARNKLRTYIETVPDLHVRLIMQLRFLDMMSWQETADYAGGNNSEDSCRMLVKRYLRRDEGKEE
jgi:predicted nuclease with TOPRIM domain